MNKQEFMRKLKSSISGLPEVEKQELLGDGSTEGRGKRIVRALFASTSLGFFNVLFIVGPYAGLVGGMIGLWAGAGTIALSGVATILALIVAPLFPSVIFVGGINIAALVFASIGVSALGVLAVIGMWKLTKLFLEMTRRYVLFNLRIVKGETR